MHRRLPADAPPGVCYSPLVFSLLVALALIQSSPLAERHRRWLEEEVHFVIGQRDKARFLALDDEEARDGFIRDFWARGGSTATGFDQAHRQQHLARLEEADRLFTLVETTPGRFTERGRAYQILGPPGSREVYSWAGNRLYPLELWHYTGRTEAFLPESFYLIFFREGGYRDYRMWSPIADGAQALLQYHDPGQFLLDEHSAHEELRRVDIELAQAVRNLVPGDGGDGPAFAAESLLVNLRNYADMMERYRSLDARVVARASFQRLGISSIAAVIYDAAGIPQVHYALEVPASKLQWSHEEDRFGVSFGVACRMLDVSGREADAFEDWIDVDVSEDEKRSLAGQALSFQGRLILSTGRYRLDFTLVSAPGGTSDTVSIPVEVPGASGGDSAPILLGRSRQRLASGPFPDIRPFQIDDFILNPSSDGSFSAKEALAYVQLAEPTEWAKLHWSLATRGESGRIVWEAESEVSPGPPGIRHAEQVIPLHGIRDGAYTLRVELPDGRREIPMTIDSSKVPQPVRVLARDALPAGHGRIRFQRGVLFARAGDTGSAIEEMEEAARLLPRDLEIHSKLAILLYATAQYQRVVLLLGPLALHYPNESDLLVLLGYASLRLGKSADAISYLERVLAFRPHDPQLATALLQARQQAGSVTPP